DREHYDRGGNAGRDSVGREGQAGKIPRPYRQGRCAPEDGAPRSRSQPGPSSLAAGGCHGAVGGSMKRAVALVFALLWAGSFASGGDTWKARATIRGTVVDSRSGDPVAGAQVRIQAELGDPVFSEADGGFTIRTVRDIGEPVTVTAGALDTSGLHPA